MQQPGKAGCTSHAGSGTMLDEAPASGQGGGERSVLVAGPHVVCPGGFMGKVMLQGSSTPVLAQNCTQHRAISRTRWLLGPQGLSGRGQPAAVSHCIHHVALFAAFMLEEALRKEPTARLAGAQENPRNSPILTGRSGIASECSAGISCMAKAGKML